ncbi:expressed protein [Arabidopsis lyrata subsp. lyrata]|uniref:Expressed protein n=1 Tax=Arabidopsis lyrata subsp. lyrata TaxID=81972 RepID=D7MHI9_ARALL|nr:expressed protein [Arabidopsis lyrata subsp. lyrata]
MTKRKTNSKRKPKDSSSRVAFSEGRVTFEHPSTKKPRNNKAGDSTQENETSQGFTTPIPDMPKGFKEGKSSVSAHSRPRGGSGRSNRNLAKSFP